MRPGVGCKSEQEMAMIQMLPVLERNQAQSIASLAYLKAVPEGGQTLVFIQGMGFPARNLSLMICHERIHFLLCVSCLGCCHCFSFLQQSVGQNAHEHPAACDVVFRITMMRILGCLVEMHAVSGLP